MSPAMMEAIVVIVAKYGPTLAAGLIEVFQKKDATLADLQAVLAEVKPYEAYGIPAVAPTQPTGGA